MTDSKMAFIIIGIIWSLTLLRSFLIMFTGKSIFKRASKNEKTAVYPIINLFTMLEICEINTFFGILFFVPVLNLIVLTMMSFKLGVVFNTRFIFKIGLVICPLFFYLILSMSKKPYRLSDEEYFKAMDRIRDKTINLMTDEEIRREVARVPEEKKEEVDSIFKSNIQMMEQVEPYKAAKIDLYGLEKLKNHEDAEDPTLRDLGFAPRRDDRPQRQEEVKTEEKKSDVEVIDL